MNTNCFLARSIAWESNSWPQASGKNLLNYNSEDIKYHRYQERVYLQHALLQEAAVGLLVWAFKLKATVGDGVRHWPAAASVHGPGPQPFRVPSSNYKSEYFKTEENV
ncbi:hypothetical protein PHLCEN_2v3992 [Hermanssonia centrifuga]|uniref:Uncharacterized protein n=1 Tax=Hermanssonia centrifuga TaxID=98765 RepID=A0A2R6Q7C5_9APHY|nr:hypothetical protein PHLCEN_2v3992 [Hermanssonia centrifuga]